MKPISFLMAPKAVKPASPRGANSASDASCPTLISDLSEKVVNSQKPPSVLIPGVILELACESIP